MAEDVDDGTVALEERLAWCEAQLGLVRKRMFSMGILIALLAALLIWRTKLPEDLVRSGAAATFSRVEVVSENGWQTVLDGRCVQLQELDGEGKTTLAAPEDGGYVLSTQGSDATLKLRPGRIEMQHAKGSLELEPDQLIFLGSGDRVGQTDMGPGFLAVTGPGGWAAVDSRKDALGAHVRDTDGKTASLKPRD